MKIAAFVTALALLSGCRASMQAQGSARLDGDASGEAEGSASASMEGEAEGAGESEQATGSTAPGGAPEAAPVESSQPALLGARHDLRLATEQATIECQCLKVALGAPGSPAFRWKTLPPNTDPDSQLVVALTSEGQACEGEPKDSLGASYWGYQRRGNDVVVLVESAGRGRPLTFGGIIPKPFGDGQVYVAPASKRTPYGRGKDGARQCKLGNPGPARAVPAEPTEAEG